MRKRGVYKIVVVDFGSYLPYLYKRTFWFTWKFIKVGNLEPTPYWGSVIELQKQYNVPDHRISFDLKKPKQP